MWRTLYIPQACTELLVKHMCSSCKNTVTMKLKIGRSFYHSAVTLHGTPYIFKDARFDTVFNVIAQFFQCQGILPKAKLGRFR